MDSDISKVEDRFRPSGWLLDAHTAMSAAFERFAVSEAAYNATVLDLVVRLRFADGQTLRGVDLGKQLSKSAGYVSRVIDQAEDAGLVTRGPDPGDRRAQRITLTDQGKSVFEESAPYFAAVLDHTIYDSLDDAEVETLIELLRKVADSAHKLLNTGFDNRHLS